MKSPVLTWSKCHSSHCQMSKFEKPPCRWRLVFRVISLLFLPLCSAVTLHFYYLIKPEQKPKNHLKKAPLSLLATLKCTDIFLESDSINEHVCLFKWGGLKRYFPICKTYACKTKYKSHCSNGFDTFYTALYVHFL